MNVIVDRATLRLFNGLYTPDKDVLWEYEGVIEGSLMYGFVLDPAIELDDERLMVLREMMGVSGEQANQGFHKSFATVRDTSEFVLRIQQAAHYFSTYGVEAIGRALGLDSSGGFVYIPHEKLNIPEIDEDVPVLYVKALDRYDLLELTANLVSSGMALHEQTIIDLATLVEANLVDLSESVELIQNREFKVFCYDYYDLAPSDPVEYLRYVIYRLTGETLLIKNDYMIGKIKMSDGVLLDDLLLNAPEDLASVFFRFKPLFLAMKSISGNKAFFNRLRKDANRMHKPMKADYLNDVTRQIKEGEFHVGELVSHLQTALIWRKIRLAYALYYRYNPPSTVVYKVRNGRAWVEDFEWPEGLDEELGVALDAVLTSISEDMRETLEGRTVYIPKGIHYALPATQKQFTGNIPSGTFVDVGYDDLLVGIHWLNTDRRIDLDLSLIDYSGKIGWDASYRSESRDKLFSGDNTDARPPLGASEFFYKAAGSYSPALLCVNYFNHANDSPVPMRVIVGSEKPSNFGRDYLIDPNRIMAQALTEITERQYVLGLLVGERFYFCQTAIGNGITVSANGQTGDILTAYIAGLMNSIDIDMMLENSGVNVVNERPEDGQYIDLSPEALDKSTFIDLLQGLNLPELDEYGDSTSES